jgi:hypothetical protein
MSLKNRFEEEFLPLNVKQGLQTLVENGSEQKCLHLKEQTVAFYQTCLDYLKKWSSPLEVLKCFKCMRMDYIKTMKFDEIQSCIQYLQSKQVQINDSKLFDQFCNLKTYVSELGEGEVLLDKQWVKFFKKCPNPELNSELIICHFYFAIPSHNANIERVFSLINSQWIKDRNRLCLESVKGLTFVKLNLRHLSCEDFHKYIVSDKRSSLLKKKVTASDKYQHD